MSNQRAAQSCGSGFVTLLTILFIGLKLTGYITWSWWWVLSPIWISWGIAIILLIIIYIAYVWMKENDRKKRHPRY